jgi:hypothetical protein
MDHHLFLCVLCELWVRPGSFLVVSWFSFVFPQHSPGIHKKLCLFVAENTPFVCILYYKSRVRGHKLRLYGHDPTQTKSFFKSRENTRKIGCKSLTVSYLHFSRGHEKGVKISGQFFSMKKAGQAQKRGLNALFSISSLSRSRRGTRVGQNWDKILLDS